MAPAPPVPRSARSSRLLSGGVEPPESTDLVAELIAVSKIYGKGDTQVTALDNLSLGVERGDYVAVMGTSGSGKSTAMNIMGCLDRPTCGRYVLNGVAVETLSDDELAGLRNRELGFVFQQFHLLPQLSALDNVMLPMVYAGVPLEQRQQRGWEALERVGLEDRIHNKPNALSGGQQQRVAVARAMINRPSMLLADEPTGALDTRTTSEILQIFDDLNAEGVTIILVTHEHDVGERARRVVQFSDGRIAH